MNHLKYVELFLQKTDIPDEAKSEFMAIEKRILAEPELKELFAKLEAELYDFEIGVNDALEALNSYEEIWGINQYTLHFIFLVHCTQLLYKKYQTEGVSEDIFWDTMDDFRCKLLECKEVKGVWGTFVGTWFAGFLDFTRFALGRFQYELRGFGRDSYEKNGLLIKKDDPVYNFHIPSSGKPFGPEARLESYRKAYEFFGYDKKDEPIVFVCSSWLLYPAHNEFLPKDSNILSFMRDFDIIDSWDNDKFGDSWRVFGGYHDLPVDELPENTSLRRAFKKRLQEGKKTGGGYGVIVFDGEKIL